MVINITQRIFFNFYRFLILKINIMKLEMDDYKKTEKPILKESPIWLTILLIQRNDTIRYDTILKGQIKI